MLKEHASNVELRSQYTCVRFTSQWSNSQHLTCHPDQQHTLFPQSQSSQSGLCHRNATCLTWQRLLPTYFYHKSFRYFVVKNIVWKLFQHQSKGNWSWSMKSSNFQFVLNAQWRGNNKIKKKLPIRTLYPVY